MTLHRESKKENAEYRRNALQAFAMVLHELDVNKFTEIYEIVQEVLVKVSSIVVTYKDVHKYINYFASRYLIKVTMMKKIILRKKTGKRKKTI